MTSVDSPMAELAGADAVYVDPLDVGSIREGIARSFRPTPRRVGSWTDVAAGDPGGLRGARVILIDADVLGRQRTGR